LAGFGGVYGIALWDALFCPAIAAKQLCPAIAAALVCPAIAAAQLCPAIAAAQLCPAIAAEQSAPESGPSARRDTLEAGRSPVSGDTMSACQPV
jgi:hypothetical protein